MSGRFADLLPRAAVLVEATAEMWDEPLLPEEAPFVAAASLERRREYAAGRASARRALAALGLPRLAIPPSADRAPRWPEGAVGSISHTHGLCIAAAARSEWIRGLGVDAECRRRLEPALTERVCTPSERARLAALGAAGDATLVFSAKESFFKCVFPLTGARIDFLDVEIEIDPALRRLTGRLLARASHLEPWRGLELEGRYVLGEAHVVTAFAIPCESLPLQKARDERIHLLRADQRKEVSAARDLGVLAARDPLV